MTALKLLANNYVPESAGEAKESPTVFTDVVSSGFTSNRNNYHSNSAARLIAELKEQRAQDYINITGKELSPENFSKASSGNTPSLSFGGILLDGGGFETVDEVQASQALHTGDTYVNSHIQELKDQDPIKYGNLKTDSEIMEQAKKKAAMSADEFDSVSARATDMSAFVGGIVGSLGGAMTDPINIVTLPLGAGVGGSILRAMAVEAGIQAGIEAATQPEVMRWQKEIGREYDLGDAAENVMMAATLGGAFVGVARGAKPSAQATFALMQKSKTFNSVQKQASGYMSRFAHFKEAEPNPKVNDTLHTDTVKAVNDVVVRGESPAIAELPMTSKQFSDIDTTDTAGLTQIQKDTLSQVEQFKEVTEPITAKELQKSINKDVKDVSVSFSETGDMASLNKIVVSSDARNSGIGSDVMSRIVEWADANGKTVSLTPSKDFGGSVPRLKRFYKKFGFVENKGANKDFTVSDTFVRQPKEPEAVPVDFNARQAPRTVKQIKTDLKEFNSNEFTRAKDTAFDQLVESEPKATIELDDGQVVTIKQLQESLADDQKLLDEISICAIG